MDHHHLWQWKLGRREGEENSLGWMEGGKTQERGREGERKERGKTKEREDELRREERMS